MQSNDAGGALPPGACEDVTQPETAQLLTHRKLPQSKAIAIDNDLRGTLRNFGLGMVGTLKFEGRIKELVANLGPNKFSVVYRAVLRIECHERFPPPSRKSIL